jgi:hypothetical protein
MSAHHMGDWSSLMDPDFWAPALTAGTSVQQGSSCRAAASGQCADSSAGVAVSLPRPTLFDEPDYLEGSSHD